MNLVIRAQSLQSEPLSQAITCRFDERGGTIGRSDSNTLTLPDPERHVSRLQAEVGFARGVFTLRNVGSANAIVANGRTVNPGEAIDLGSGDEIVIGGYTLRVVVEDEFGAAPSRPGIEPHTVVRASAGEARTDPARRAGAPRLNAGQNASRVAGPVADPFADLFAAPMSPRSPVPPAAPPASRAPAASGPADARARLPDDFDPFAPPTPPRAPPPLAALPGDLGLTDLLGGSGAGSSLDSAFDLAPVPASEDPLAGFLDGGFARLKPAVQGKPGAGGKPSADPLLALFGGNTEQAQTGPAVFNHTPDLHAAYEPPPLRARPPPVPPAQPVQPAQRPSAASDDALWAAFCAGAGLGGTALARRLDPALMRELGQLLADAVEGSLRLSALRTAAKQELRLPVTTIQSRDNNPLKFSVDAAAALQQLLQPPLPGFMGAAEAMRDVMDDLVGHHMGTLAGTRAALDGVLQRFEPAPLERALASRGVLDALLPMQRRARLWELYLQHHAAVREQAQEDFQTLFGRAFAKAYEEQLDRLAAARPPGRPGG